jgi:hypothetical protein
MLFQMDPFYPFLSATAIAAGLMLGLILVSILGCEALVGLRIPSEIFTPRVKKSRKSLRLSSTLRRSKMSLHLSHLLRCSFFKAGAVRIGGSVTVLAIRPEEQRGFSRPS